MRESLIDKKQFAPMQKLYTKAIPETIQSNPIYSDQSKKTHANTCTGAFLSDGIRVRAQKKKERSQKHSSAVAAAALFLTPLTTCRLDAYVGIDKTRRV